MSTSGSWSPWSPAASRRWLRGLILPCLLIVMVLAKYVHDARFDNQDPNGDSAWVGHWLTTSAIGCAIWIVLYGCIFAIATTIKRPSHPATGAADDTVDDTARRLEALDRLRAEGRISEQEWAEQRRAVLSRL